MLNRKGQGLTEYGIILLFVALIGTGIWFSGGFGNDEQGMYSTISIKLKSIIDGDSVENYDTDEKGRMAGNAGYLSFTSLSVKRNDGKTYRMGWKTINGHRVYTVYRGTNNGMGTLTDWQGYTYGHTNSAESGDGGKSVSTYFLATDGNYYKITEYSDGRETTLKKYNGTPKSNYIRK